MTGIVDIVKKKKSSVWQARGQAPNLR